MGVIQTIHMDNRGVFEEGKSSFESCAIANFVYGPNGSGKSTISNFLRSQNGLPVKYFTEILAEALGLKEGTENE